MSTSLLRILRGAAARAAVKLRAVLAQEKPPSTPGPKAPEFSRNEMVQIQLTTSASPEKLSPTITRIPGHRPRYWNIGLDFGTAFTKCVVRNLGTQEAFVVPLCSPPFLFPS